jgi:rubrerythrin
MSTSHYDRESEMSDETLEQMIERKITELIRRLIELHSCDGCHVLMLPRNADETKLWCPMCGREKDAPQS